MARYGKWINLIGKVFGGVLIAYPGIQAAEDAIRVNDAASFPPSLLYRYTGWSPTTNSWQAPQAGLSVASIAGGIIVMKLFSWLSKRF